MTADKLAAFIAQVRAECDAALVKLATVDPATLPPDVRRIYLEQRQRWRELRALIEHGAIDLHLAAAGHAGRVLTQEESRALAKSMAEAKRDREGQHPAAQAATMRRGQLEH